MRRSLRIDRSTLSSANKRTGRIWWDLRAGIFGDANTTGSFSVGFG